MNSPPGHAVDLPARSCPIRTLRISGGLGVALLLALSCNEVGAAALGSIATSVGLFAAVATLLVITGWPEQLPTTVLSAAGCALLVAGAAAWLWRAQMAQRVVDFAGPPGRLVSARPNAAAGLIAPVVIALPAGFDRASLLLELRLNFVRLQSAWDLGDLPALAALTTSEMLEELCSERSHCAPDRESNRTDVVTLRAELLGFEELADDVLVGVEFSGLIRESAGQGATAFRELWMFARARQGASNWRLARQQALL